MVAAIYARKSTEQNSVGDEEKSVARQIEHGKAYAARKGWAVDDPMCIQTTASRVPSSRSVQDSSGC
jgi:DNA invertase Pin-like site-specific DNA recombinase